MHGRALRRAHSLVVSPKTRRVTHLVAEPEHRVGLGRLVPVDLVASGAGTVQLSCDLATFDALPRAEQTEVVPGAAIEYGLITRVGAPTPLQTDVRDLVPQGEVAMSSGTVVSATDGPIGVVAGFVIDAGDHAIVTVLVTEERLLWGHKVVAIPIAAVTAMGADAIRLNLATADVPPARAAARRALSR